MAGGGKGDKAGKGWAGRISKLRAKHAERVRDWVCGGLAGWVGAGKGKDSYPDIKRRSGRQVRRAFGYKGCLCVCIRVFTPAAI